MPCDPWPSTQPASPRVTWRESGTGCPLFPVKGVGSWPLREKTHSLFWGTDPPAQRRPHTVSSAQRASWVPSQRRGLSRPWAAVSCLPAGSARETVLASWKLPPRTSPHQWAAQHPAGAPPTPLPSRARPRSGQPSGQHSPARSGSSAIAQPVRPLPLPCAAPLGPGHRSHEVPPGMLVGQGLPSSQAAVPPPLRRPLKAPIRAWPAEAQRAGCGSRGGGAGVLGGGRGVTETDGKSTAFTITSATRLPSAPARVSARILGTCGQQGRDLGSDCGE